MQSFAPRRFSFYDNERNVAVKTKIVIGVIFASIMFGNIIFAKEDGDAYKNNTPKMKEIYEVFILNENNPAVKLNNEGNLLLIGKDYLKAIEKYLEAQKLDPNNPLILDNLAWAYIMNGNYDKSIEVSRSSISENKGNATSYYYRGVAYFYTGNIKLAEEDLSKAISLDQNYPYTHYYLAHVYERKGYIEEALFEAETAAFILGDVWNPEVALFLGDLYAKAGMFQKALLQYQKLIDEPEYAFEAYYGLGVCYGYFGDFNKSEKNFLKAKDLDDENPMVSYGLAKLYSTDKTKLKKSLDYAQEALSEDEENPKYLYLVGWVYYQMGEIEDALRFIKEASSRDIENSEYKKQVKMLEEELSKKSSR